MPEDFLVARNPEPGSTLPWLVRVPLPGRPVVLKVKDTWPRTAKVYCHRAEWPADAEVVERVPTRSCSARGAAIDLVLDRGREFRSQFVFTNARGREMIFWQSARWQYTLLVRGQVSLTLSTIGRPGTGRRIRYGSVDPGSGLWATRKSSGMGSG